MSSKDGNKSPSSQVPLYIWGGSQVYKKRFGLICTALRLKLNSRSGGPLMLLQFLMTCISSWRSLRLMTCLAWMQMIQMLGSSPFIPFISPWASHSSCQTFSERCSAPWGVL
ncbi:unnamed protein product [Prunus armeniaca]